MCFSGDASPAIPQTRNPDDPSCGFQGGIQALPNVPFRRGTQFKICTNSYCDGRPIASGALPAAWDVGEWHRLSLMTVGNNATAKMDGKVFWSGVMTGGAAPPPPQPPPQWPQPQHQSRHATKDAPPSTAETTESPPSCAGSMVVLPHSQMLVGHDYRQVQLQSDPSDTKHCEPAVSILESVHTD
jgi:hypothetical protein